MRIERELMRGAGPVAVLKLLQRREMYGYELVETLDQRTQGALAMGQSTLYPMLYNLEAQGFIEATWKEASDKATTGPRERKYYRLTDKGRKRLADESAQWEAVIRAMKALGVASHALVGRLSPAPANARRFA
ncbi:MAG: helix-turn-helix transcriptional regulator [Planctomycetes bacterium]|nr:helix-turn-helix transcriptional regulator [Planctomycetota bacterium]